VRESDVPGRAAETVDARLVASGFQDLPSHPHLGSRRGGCQSLRTRARDRRSALPLRQGVTLRMRLEPPSPFASARPRTLEKQRRRRGWRRLGLVVLVRERRRSLVGRRSRELPRAFVDAEALPKNHDAVPLKPPLDMNRAEFTLLSVFFSTRRFIPNGYRYMTRITFGVFQGVWLRLPTSCIAVVSSFRRASFISGSDLPPVDSVQACPNARSRNDVLALSAPSTSFRNG